MMAMKDGTKTAGSQDIIMRAIAIAIAIRSRGLLVSSPRYYFHVSISM